MVAPTTKVRNLTYKRDWHKCANCGTFQNLTWQHREASGSGGRGKKAPALTPADGLTLCLTCNQEAEASGQERALHLGHKIRRNRGGIPAHAIPFFVVWKEKWLLPDLDGGHVETPAALALELLQAASAFTTKAVA